MRSIFTVGLVVLAASSSFAQSPPAPASGGLAGMKCLDHPRDGANCVSPTLQATIAKHAASARLASSGGSGGISAMSSVAPLLPFHAIGANFYEDVIPAGFVDQDPSSPGFSDFSCHNFTYDGHQGCDIPVRSFGEVDIGVPVFAVRDGVVYYSQDGFTDHNVIPPGDDGNYMILDHGDGTTTWYFHMKQGSVAYSTGQTVNAGAQVGLVASSGWSFGPHLHFQMDQSWLPYEPMAGACSHPVTGYARQEPLNIAPYFFDFWVSTTDLGLPSSPALPFTPPSTNQVKTSDPAAWYLFEGANLAPGATWHVKFQRPNGTFIDKGTGPFFNTEFWRTYGIWFYWPAGEMQTTPGTWHYQFFIDNQLMVNAPVEVVTTVNPNFNRPPEPITVSFDPVTPAPDRPLFCRVHGPVALDDLDWDIVRFHYVWKVNNVIVRDVVSAGRADAIPRSIGLVGQSVSCTVTPNDGKVDGGTVNTSTTFATDPWVNRGKAKYGTASNVPYLEGTGPLTAGSPGALTLTQGKPAATTLLMIGPGVGNIPFLASAIVPWPVTLNVSLVTDANGGFALPFVFPSGVPSGITIAVQAWMADAGAWLGVSCSNGASFVTP